MNYPPAANNERQERILDAAAVLIHRQGYDKTTMSEIADEASVSRGIVYLHFANKDALFEALLLREFLKYVDTWLEYIEADQQGGTFGGIYRAVLHAVNSNPFMTAMVKRDRRVYGSYLRKPNNLFVSLSSPAIRTEFIRAMQDAGAIRNNIDPAIVTQITDILSYGVLGMYGVESVDNTAQFDDLMQVIATMLDQFLLPEDGGNRAAGKAVIRELAGTARTQFEQMRQLAGEK